MPSDIGSGTRAAGRWGVTASDLEMCVFVVRAGGGGGKLLKFHFSSYRMTKMGLFGVFIGIMSKILKYKEDAQSFLLGMKNLILATRQGCSLHI